jgi:uroporphyrinogen-III synthase
VASRVLVTRPQPGASRTAARLKSAGFQPVEVPLTEIVALESALPDGDIEDLVVSSANAVRNAPAGLVSLLSNKPVFAVGDETAAAASEAGYADVRSSSGSAADLLRDIAAGVPANARIAYLCGRVRLDTLEVELAALGLDVVGIETYDTAERWPRPQELSVLDDGGPIAAALVYSAKGAAYLARLVSPRTGTIFHDTAFICISPRVAREFAVVAGGNVLTATTPDENAMFDLLVRLGHDPAPFPINLA